MPSIEVAAAIVSLSAATSLAMVATLVTPGSAASDAGIEAGDQLLKVGDVEVKDEGFAVQFRARYADAVGSTIPVVVRRNDADHTVQMQVRRELIVTARLLWDAAASPKAARVRNGILKGTTGN